MRIKQKLVLLYFLFCSINLTVTAQTSLVQQDSAWSLYVDNLPFPIKGVTFGYSDDVTNYDAYFADLVSMGVNTIRTWGTDENTLKLLDAAHSHGIKVMLGIWLRHGKPGMEADDQFNYVEDKQGMEEMYEQSLKVVKQYKDHPALLLWGIGNEVYLNLASDAEKQAYSLFLEQVCSSIKSIDSNHPIASVGAWTFAVNWWQNYVPSLDVYGLNVYGSGASMIGDELIKMGVKKPYIITEYGVTGEWESPKDNKGIIIEPSDEQKYETISKGYPNWIQSKSNCLGVYVFHYASSNDFIGPWLFTHVKGLKRPAYWAIREAFSGQKPINQVPKITHFSMTNDSIKSETWISVELSVLDAENDELAISFYYNQRTGSRKRRDQLIALNQRGNLKDGFEIKLPKEHGAIKVYAYAFDSFNNLGIASSSVVVLDKERKAVKFLVPRGELPFYVYKDGEVNPYIASAYMGNHKEIKTDLVYSKEFKTGKAAFKLAYEDFSNWYGLGFVDPPGDWGEIAGGYNLTGDKTLSFWAKSNRKNIKAKVGLGMITQEKPFYDTAIKSMEITIGTQWKKYSIKLDGLDLSCIRTGFVLFTTSTGLPQDILLDDIVYE